MTPISEAKKIDLEKQGYRIVGNHSAIKVCEWCKKAIRGKDVCYKEKFYGINSHQCIQMTPSLHVCNQRCIWCWRDIDFTNPSWQGPVDDPKSIIDGCIKAHVKYLYGFGGLEEKDQKKYGESLKPKHFAISLSGEPTAYPRLAELIDEIKNRNMTAYLVTNGNFPDVLETLLKHEPTQLYITLPAPDRETYLRLCKPTLKDSWERIARSLSLIKHFSCPTVLRLTLVKGENMINPEEYARLISTALPTYVELKAYVWVGHSRKRLELSNMPMHEDIKKFAGEIARYSGYAISAEKKESRVVQLSR